MSDQVSVRVTELHDGRRAAAVLAAELPAVGRKGAKELIARGRVRLDGRVLKKDVSVKVGEELEVSGLVDRPRPNPKLEFSVAREAEHWLVVNKPAGMPCHPLRAQEMDTLINALLAHYPEVAGVGYGPLESGLVHRIDVDTSGALLVARNQGAFEALSGALEAGEIYKEYVAICAGTPRRHVIDAPIGNHRTDKRRAAVRLDDTQGKPCVTEVLRVVKRGAFSEVHVRADRATRHQVRVHLSWIGHPLVGDVLYGGPPCTLGRHLLHAARLKFEFHSESVDVHVPLPADVLSFLQA